MVKISVVSPVYKGEKHLPQLIQRIEDAVSTITMNFEIILVDDRGPDNSWQLIERYAKENSRIVGIKLSRNFGQHYAITAGLNQAKGEWIVVMDCDLQDRPEEIPNLYYKTQEGYDIVLAQRRVRQDNWLKKASSKIFYSVFAYLTDTVQDASVANFGIYHQKVINAILSMKDHIRYFPTMVQWVGFSKAYLHVEHSAREDGESSSYSWGQLITLALNNIIAFSDKPLQITVRIGLGISLLSLIIGVDYLYKYFVGEIQVLGFASVFISIWFLSGLIIFILGILGIYLGKTFDKVKDRPTYIIDELITRAE
jgi:polyisoprenyl-phosphate glycosyltransferase